MKNVLIVGSGDVARRAIPWLAKRFKVYALTRQSDSCAQLRALGAQPLIADLDDHHSLSRIAGVANALLHFAPPPGSGEQDGRTARLLAALGRRGSVPLRMVYISTTGVYGDYGGALISETDRCRPDTARARRRLHAEQQLRHFGVRNGVCISVLRAPGIYAGNRLPIARLERGAPILCADEDVYTNHIHAEDLARLACIALFRGRPGRVYNAVDDTHMKMGDYFEFAADALGLARPPRMGKAELRKELTPMAMSFMAESRRLSNDRIRNELRLKLLYPTVCDGYAAALAVRGRERLC